MREHYKPNEIYGEYMKFSPCAMHILNAGREQTKKDNCETMRTTTKNKTENNRNDQRMWKRKKYRKVE